MALVKFGGGITQMSGSIGGTTFARNRYGNYARAKTKPTNPQSALQTLVRSTLTAMSERWAQTLTAAQRTAWNLYGSSVVMQNRLGENVQLSGYNHYLRSNTLLVRGALAPVDAGPVIFEIPEADPTLAITVSEGTQLISFAFDDTLEWLDEDGAYMHLFQGSPQNPQRNFFDGPWRYLGSIAGDAITPPTTPDAQPAQFAVAEGQLQWVYARIQRADGRVSQPFRAQVLVSS